MNLFSNILRIFVGLGTVLLSGCTFPAAETVVPQSQTNVMHRLEFGTVVAVKRVMIEGDRSALGGWGGAAIGSAAASPHDGRYDTGARLATAGGGVAGAMAGQAVEEAVTREEGQEITIELDSGRMVMITQESGNGDFHQGDRVTVAHGHGSALVRMAANG